MGFVYDKERRLAVDLERQLILSQAPGFFDQTRIYRYRLRGPSLEIDFDLVPYLEMRSYVYRNVHRNERVEVAVFIVESTIDVRKAGEGSLSTLNNRETLKEELRTAVFTEFSMGGEYLETIPDFKVQFVAGLSELAFLRTEASQPQ